MDNSVAFDLLIVLEVLVVAVEAGVLFVYQQAGAELILLHSKNHLEIDELVEAMGDRTQL
jgi:hypothetical protein